MLSVLRLPRTYITPRLTRQQSSQKSNKKKKPPPPVDGMPGLYTPWGQRWCSENHNFFEKKMIMKLKEIWPLIFCVFVKVGLLVGTIIRHPFTRDDLRWYPGGQSISENYDDIVNDRPPRYRKLLNFNQKVEWPEGLKEACEALDPENETDPCKLPPKPDKSKKPGPKKEPAPDPNAKPPCE